MANGTNMYYGFMSDKEPEIGHKNNIPLWLLGMLY